MTIQDREQRLAESLEDWQLRRREGEAADPRDYAEGLGDAFDDFLELLEVESSFDDLLDPPPLGVQRLPREFGAYTLERELGRGATGVVYEATNRDLGRREAVKILRTGFDAEPTALERFRREAKALARIHHDHVVEVYGAGEVEDHPYYAMTLLEGASLSSLARRGELPEPRELCRHLAPIADALHTLHEAGIVHRDVKPSNILQDAHGNFILADFGLARDAGGLSMTTTGQALGTPLYMSPEQMLGDRKAIDGRADVYGLGATLYQLLAGRPVFPTRDIRALLRMVVSERPDPIGRLVDDLPPGLEPLVMKSLEKRPDDRYPTAAALRDDLLAVAEGGRVRGRPVSSTRRAARWVRARALPIAAVVLVALGVWLWWGSRDGRIQLRTIAGAQVTLNGAPHGQVPEHLAAAGWPIDVEPGRWEVKVTHPLFYTGTSVQDVGPGEDETVTLPLLMLDPSNPEAIRLYAALSGLPHELFEAQSGTRGGDGSSEAVELLWPRGRVRPGDLREVAVGLTEPLPEGARLVLRRADGTVLHEAPFAPENALAIAPLPEAVVEDLAPGDDLAWGLVPPEGEGEARWQPLEIVAPSAELEADLERLETLLAEQPAAARAYFLGRRLLAADLPTAALLVARAVETQPDGTDIAARGIEQEAYVALDLVGSRPWEQLQTVLLDRDREATYEAWFE